MTGNLFTSCEPTPPSIPAIPGLTYLPEALTAAQQSDLLTWIDYQPWRNDLQRRVQHYGWRYDYRARRVTRDMKLGPIPDPITRWCDHLAEQGFFDQPPDQVIINEYPPGQGIAAHVDCKPCFGKTIVVLSLCSPVQMEFTQQTSDHKTSIDLEPGSLLVLTDQARYHWKHGITARLTDPSPPGRRSRRRRVSVTFRQVVTGQGIGAEIAAPRLDGRG